MSIDLIALLADTSKSDEEVIQKALKQVLNHPVFFSSLFSALRLHQPIIQNRAIEVIEKVTRKRPNDLIPYQAFLLYQLSSIASTKAHTKSKLPIKILITLITRLPLSGHKKYQVALQCIQVGLKEKEAPHLIPLIQNWLANDVFVCKKVIQWIETQPTNNTRFSLGIRRLYVQLKHQSNQTVTDDLI